MVAESKLSTAKRMTPCAALIRSKRKLPQKSNSVQILLIVISVRICYFLCKNYLICAASLPGLDDPALVASVAPFEEPRRELRQPADPHREEHLRHIWKWMRYTLLGEIFKHVIYSSQTLMQVMSLVLCWALRYKSFTVGPLLVDLGVHSVLLEDSPTN